MAKKAYVGAPKSVTIKNMLGAVGSFESGTFTATSNFTLNTSDAKFGSACGQFSQSASATELLFTLPGTYTLNSSHIYYISAWIKQKTSLSISFDVYWPIAEPVMMSGKTNTALDTWQQHSLVTNRSSFTSGSHNLRIDSNNYPGSNAVMLVDGLMLVDLTEAFGSGSEPDAAWCDTNIPFTTGSCKVSVEGTQVAREVKKIYVGVDNIARNVTKGYVGIDGIARQCFQSIVPKALSEYAVGESVWMNMGGVATEFLVVNQGIPGNSSIYDSSCNGTWLLMKNLYEEYYVKWHTSDVNDYENSSGHTYLNSTFLGLFDANIQAAIKQVKMPYRKGSGISKTVTSGASGLSTKIFLLSGTEVNLVDGSQPSGEGYVLSYFSGCAKNGADSGRIAYLNGTDPKAWNLRSPYCGSAGSIYNLFVAVDGTCYAANPTDRRRIRPALILPLDTVTNAENNFIVG